MRLLLLLALVQLTSWSAIASEKSSSPSVKYLGATHFPIGGKGNERALIASYVIKTLPASDSRESEEKYIKSVFAWACNNRHFKIFFDTKTKHNFTQVHIFLARKASQSEQTRVADNSPFEDANEFVGFQYIERAFSITDGKCGLRVDTKTSNDNIKNILAKLLYRRSG